MTFTFEREVQRETELNNERLRSEFKANQSPVPVVLCDVLGRFEDGSGNTVSAAVPGRIGYVYARAFAEGVPAEFLSVRGVPAVSGVPCWAGYAEDSTEIEILFEFIIDKDNSDTIDDLRKAQSPTYTYTRDLIPLRCTPTTGLQVRVDPFVYYNGLERKSFLSDVVTLTAPGAGLKRYTLVYLDIATNTIMASNGSTVPNAGAIDPPLVDPPNGCYPSAWVQIANGQTTIDRDRDIVDARFYLNTVSHLPLNKLDATTSPTVNDDSGDGYSVNSSWIDTTNDNAYICVDATLGAAVWRQTNGLAAIGSSTDNAIVRWNGTSGDTLQNSNVTIDDNDKLTLPDSATYPPLNITERSTAPTTPTSGDIYLDDGTNTASGNPGYRRYTGSAWEDVGATGGGGGYPFNTLTVDFTDADADYATVTAAEAAAIANDLIEVGPGSNDEATLTVNVAVDIVGSGIDITTITSNGSDSVAISVANAAATIQNLTASSTGSFLSTCQGISINSTISVTMRRVKATASAASTTASAILCSGAATHTLDHCEGYANNSGTTKYGLNINSGCTVVVIGGVYDGDTADINNGGTVELRGPTLANGTILGDWYGWYYYSGKLYQTTIDDTDNTSGVSTEFAQNGSSYPSFLTQVDAPSAVNTNSVHSSLFILGTFAETSWKFRAQTNIDIEAQSADSWHSIIWRDIFIRDGDYTADLTYYFWLCANSSGIDENTFSRAALNWDSSGGNWRIRHEWKDGTTQTNSAWVTLTDVVAQPLHIRIVIRNDAGKTTRLHFAQGELINYLAMKQIASVSTSETWDQIFTQMSMSRGAGVIDTLYIGAIDYSTVGS